MTRGGKGEGRGKETTGKVDLLEGLGRIVSLIDLDRREQNNTLRSPSSKARIPPTGDFGPHCLP